MLPDVCGDRIKIGRDFADMVAHQPLSKTIAAIRSASVRHQQQSGLRIFVLQPVHDGVIVLAARIEIARTLKFL
jgi:hypothetical protein